MNNKKLSILIVDDDLASRDLTRQIFSEHDCIVAKTAAEAIEKFNDFQPDMIFLDVMLPDGTGHDVLKKIRAKNEDVFVSMLSNLMEPEDVKKASEVGIQNYILKPISRQKAKECLKEFENYKRSKSIKNLSILIIDDDWVVAELITDFLDGCSKAIANNGAEGVKRFKRLTPDITFLDIGLPDMRGIDILKELIAHDPEAFVVMLTGSDLAKDVHDAQKYGAMGYMLKPITGAKLNEFIDKYEIFCRKLVNTPPEERLKEYKQKLRIDVVDEKLLEVPEPKPKNKEASIEKKMTELRILFVDRHTPNLERAKEQLVTGVGCTVDISGNSEDTVSMTNNGHYDIIFLDSVMEEKNGYEIAQEIRKQEKNKNAVIVAMIGRGDNANKEVDNKLWKKAGMDNYIRKPAPFEKLRSLIQTYISN